MGKVSLKYLALNQSLIYLKQASRLCSLLQDDQHPCDAYLTQIDTLHHEVLMEGNRDSQLRPQLPRRESSMEIPSKIKFRIKMSRSNSRSIDEDPYSNIPYIKNRMQTMFPSVSKSDANDVNAIQPEPIESNKIEERSPRFIRFLAPHPKPQIKRQKSNLTTTAQVHAKNSPKSPRTPIKCVNFFDDDELSSGNNSPVIHISDCGDDLFKRDNKSVGHHLRSPLANAEPKAVVSFDKENIQNNINQMFARSDLILPRSDSIIGDQTEL